MKDMNVEQLASQASGQGQKRPQVLLASSASALSQAVGVGVSDAGEGTYLVAFWGEKPTGGYSVEITSVRSDGDRVGVQLSLKDPPPDAMVTQALTYPYVTAVVRNADLTDKEVVLKDQGGRELGWPVREP